MAGKSGKAKGKVHHSTSMSKSTKAGLQFPVGRIGRLLRHARYC